MVNPSEKLREIFGEFNARLFEIATFQDVNPDPSGQLYLRDAITQAHSIAPDHVIRFLGYLITKLDDLKKNHNEFKKKALERFFKESQPNVFEISAEERHSRIPDKVQDYCSLVMEELSAYSTHLNTFNEALLDDVCSLGSNGSTAKLRFNIPVKSIAVLIRLMKDSDIIPLETKNTDLAHKIVAHFDTNKGDISYIPLKGSLSEYDVAALKYWIKKFDELAMSARDKLAGK